VRVPRVWLASCSDALAGRIVQEIQHHQYAHDPVGNQLITVQRARRQAYSRQGSKVSSRADVRKTGHAAAETSSTGPSGFFESRISTDPSAAATSTQPPLLDAVLLRHMMQESLRLATCPLAAVWRDLRRHLPPWVHTRVSSQPAGSLTRLLHHGLPSRPPRNKDSIRAV
jgi:hypothetical protein